MVTKVELSHAELGSNVLTGWMMLKIDSPRISVSSGFCVNPMMNWSESNQAGAVQIQNLGHSKSIKKGCVCSCIFKMTGVRHPTISRLPSNQNERGSPIQLTMEAMIKVTPKSKASAGVKLSRSNLSRGRIWTDFSKVKVVERFELKCQLFVHEIHAVIIVILHVWKVLRYSSNHHP